MTNDPYIPLKIISIRDEAPQARSFVLQCLDGHTFSYKAGQFLTLVFPGRFNEQRRSYSISSLPDGEPLTITVKRVDNGEFSRYLMDYCDVGSTLYAIAPTGFFVLPPQPELYSTFVFYAAGSGITPVYPLVRTLLLRHPSIRIYLSYSNHSEEESIFLKEIQMLEVQHKGMLIVEWLFSNAKNLLRARLTKSRVTEQLSDTTVIKKNSALFYLCGPYDYMQMISITLLREGVHLNQIRKEIFNTIKPPRRDLPPDTTSRRVTIFYRGERFQINVGYPQTILEAAKSNGILLPYSCEAGKCGTCAATCTKGSVWMSYNEVLLDKELAEGRVLTCTGFPVFDDVELQYLIPGS
jgi:ferredoxin-NADP reductase